MNSIFRKGDASEAKKGRGRFPVKAAGRRWLLLLLLGLAAAPAGAHGQGMPSDRGNDVIALVNGAAITRREFQVVYRQAVDRHADQGNPIDEAHIAPIRRAVIQTLVEEELLFQESRRMGIEVPAGEIEDKVAEARARFVDAAAFQKDLARRFMDESQYRRMLQRQLARERLLARAVKPVTTIAEEDIRRYYTANRERYHTPEKIHLLHFFLPKSEGDRDHDRNAARPTMEMIKAELERGGDFAALAKQYSQAPLAVQGSDLGFVQRGQMRAPLEAASFALKVGEVSPVVAAEDGFHLFKVTDRQPETQISMEEARPDIHRTLLALKRDEAVRAYVEALRGKADIRATD